MNLIGKEVAYLSDNEWTDFWEQYKNKPEEALDYYVGGEADWEESPTVPIEVPGPDYLVDKHHGTVLVYCPTLSHGTIYQEL